MRARVQLDDFDPGVEIEQLRGGGVGAIVSFVGVVRDFGSEPILQLELEHYPGMTEAALESIASDAIERWQLIDARIVHRVGVLAPLDRIVLVLASSRHRKQAFLGCEYIVDRLKTEAPFWKKETTPGGDKWVEARESDDEAAMRWNDQGVSSA